MLLQERVTLALIKPDITHVPEHQQKIFELIEKNGFKILGGGRPLLWGRASAEKFYAEHRGRFFYQRLIAFMTSAPIIPMVLEKDNAVIEWRCVQLHYRVSLTAMCRKLMGPTHIRKSRKEFPESIRGQMAKSDTWNCVHGSGTCEQQIVRTKYSPVQTLWRRHCVRLRCSGQSF